MVGTTDEKCEVTHFCEPPQKDIEFIMSEMRKIFGDDFDYQNNLQSAWAGIRPLVTLDKKEQDIKQKEEEE